MRSGWDRYLLFIKGKVLLAQGFWLTAQNRPSHTQSMLRVCFACLGCFIALFGVVGFVLLVLASLLTSVFLPLAAKEKT
jgi:hypothetical protein